MSDRTIGVGILGTGFARTTQIPCFQATPGYEVVGLYSRNMTRAYDLAKEFDLRRAFDCFDPATVAPVSIVAADATSVSFNTVTADATIYYTYGISNTIAAPTQVRIHRGLRASSASALRISLIRRARPSSVT